ncbi:MAG: hypothetical protein JXR96_25060 [Deltaproteobacteria bacterium]|nr:hypothetical protein [Deltaproteobacteria bacterium]
MKAELRRLVLWLLIALAALLAHEALLSFLAARDVLAEVLVARSPATGAAAAAAMALRLVLFFTLPGWLLFRLSMLALAWSSRLRGGKTDAPE